MSENLTDIQQALTNLDASLQKEQNDKVSKAIELFMRVDNTYKRIVFFSAGFSGEVSAEKLREHFEFLDLVDGLDELINDLEFELQDS